MKRLCRGLVKQFASISAPTSPSNNMKNVFSDWHALPVMKSRTLRDKWSTGCFVFNCDKNLSELYVSKWGNFRRLIRELQLFVPLQWCVRPRSRLNTLNQASTLSSVIKPVNEVHARCEMVQDSRVLKQVLDPIARLSPLTSSSRRLWPISNNVNVQCAHESD